MKLLSPAKIFPCSRTMVWAMASAFCRNNCWSLSHQVKQCTQNDWSQDASNDSLNYKSLTSNDTSPAPSLESSWSGFNSLFELLTRRLRNLRKQSLCWLTNIWVDLVRFVVAQDNGLTGSWTSNHLSVLLSTNSPLMKFFVFPPVKLVPVHSAESLSAIGRAIAFKMALDDMVSFRYWYR